MRAPFPYFGNKRLVAPIVWAAIGADVPNYVEPFCGSAAVFFARPKAGKIETLNDAHAFIPNFLRAVQRAPELVAAAATWPVSEIDLHARHAELQRRADVAFVERLRDDPRFFDAELAGWWVWGISLWIGSGWCATTHRKLPSLAPGGRGVFRVGAESFNTIARRLASVRVTCGDWSRVVAPSVTTQHGVTGVLLDPPYGETSGDGLYAKDGATTARDAARWAFEHGGDPRLRIALCGFEGEHDVPSGWRKFAWKSGSGYGKNDGDGRNAWRERVWFSPACNTRFLDRRLDG